jgi:hypothetical protein
MKLLLRGWERYDLDHTLIDNDISKAKPPEADVSPSDVVWIRQPSASGELGIVAKTENVSLNGNFQVTIRLMKDEIANLARLHSAKTRLLKSLMRYQEINANGLLWPITHRSIGDKTPSGIHPR